MSKPKYKLEWLQSLVSEASRIIEGESSRPLQEALYKRLETGLIELETKDGWGSKEYQITLEAMDALEEGDLIACRACLIRLIWHLDVDQL